MLPPAIAGSLNGFLNSERQTAERGLVHLLAVDCLLFAVCYDELRGNLAPHTPN